MVEVDGDLKAGQLQYSAFGSHYYRLPSRVLSNRSFVLRVGFLLALLVGTVITIL